MNAASQIRSVNREGWDGLDPDGAEDHLIAQIMEQQDDLDKIYAKCFSSEAGRKVLKHLLRLTLGQPCWVPGADPSYGYAREGQNSIVREIQMRVQKGNQK